MTSREFDPDSLGSVAMYKLLVGSVQPRPIAWVSTVAPSGVLNLAPFSFFTVASRNPPTIAISLTESERGGDKDTLANIREQGDFVVNVASRRHLGAVSRSAEDVPAEVDEFELAGMAAVPSTKVRAPRVQDASAALECVLSQLVPVGSDTLVLGRVVWVHADAAVVDERATFDHDKLDVLGRLAGPWFTGPLSRVRQSTEADR